MTDPRVPLPGSAGPATTPPGGGAAARYPLGPLIAAMGVSFNQACEQLRLAGRTRKQYRDEGMSEIVADRMAGKAGLVAYEIWPEMLDRAIAELERPCEHCGANYMPHRSDQRFCTTFCRNRGRNRPETPVDDHRRHCQACHGTYTPVRHGQRWCTRACRNAGRQRRQNSNDQEQAA